MSKLMLLVAMAASFLATPATLSARSVCAGPYDVFWVPEAHLDLVIQGENIETEPDGVWTTLTDIGSGEMAILEYRGPGSDYDSVVIHEKANSIRGSTVISFVYGHEYLVQVWRDEYSVSFPDLTELIAEDTVTMPTACYRNFVPLVVH